MLKQMQTFFAPPVYDDPETNRQARFTTYILYVLYVTVLFAILLAPFGITRPQIIIPIGLLLLLTGLLVRYLIRHNRVRAGGMLITTVVWLILTYSHIQNGGLRSTTIPTYVLVIIIASLVLQRRERLFFLFVSIGVMIAFAWLEGNGIYTFPPNENNTPLGLILSMSITLVAATALIQIAIRDLRSAIATLQDSQRRLQESNQDLQANRALLQSRSQELERRTRGLESRTRQLEAIAELTQDIAELNDLDEILQKAVHLISERFDFYHVGIFLLNAEGDYAVLRAANSEGGRKMLARQHRLKVGAQGNVGYVAATHQARVALDVGRDATHFDNPDLPHTRSEVALPMVSGGDLLGVLDIQSTQQGAFQSEDVEALQVLAGQLGVAIRNARLFLENQQTLQAVQRAYAEGTRQAWAQFLHTQNIRGYLCDELDLVNPVNEDWSPELQQALVEGHAVQPDEHTLAVPVAVRGQIIGVVRLRKSKDTPPWSAEERSLVNALVEQMGLALDSARLYTATQRRAERERLTAEIVNRIRASNDPQTILQTAVQELQRALNVPKAQVLMQTNQDQETPP